jgi:hypothetical protein
LAFLWGGGGAGGPKYGPLFIGGAEGSADDVGVTCCVKAKQVERRAGPENRLYE